MYLPFHSMKIPCHTNHRPSSENRARGPLKQELRSLWRCCARQKKIAWLFTTSRQCTLHNLSLSAASRDFNQNQHSFTVFTRPSPALLLQSMSQDGAWAGFLCSALLPCGLQTGFPPTYLSLPSPLPSPTPSRFSGSEVVQLLLNDDSTTALPALSACSAAGTAVLRASAAV